MNKICIYTICKNEEQNVLLYLDSYKYVDLMVILDTGSTDRTIELFQASGLPQLHLYQEIIEPFDFAEARNRCLNYTKELIGLENLKDWVFMYFDMDEHITDPKMTENLRTIELPLTPEYFQCHLLTINDEKMNVGRIHTDNGLCYFKGNIHEDLVFPYTNNNFSIATGVEYIHRSAVTPEKENLYIELCNRRLSTEKDPNLLCFYSNFITACLYFHPDPDSLSKEDVFNYLERNLENLKKYKAKDSEDYFWIEIVRYKYFPEEKEKIAETIKEHLNNENLIHQESRTLCKLLGEFFDDMDKKLTAFFYEKVINNDAPYKFQDYLPLSNKDVYMDLCLIYFYDLGYKKEAVKYAALAYKEDPCELTWYNLDTCIEALSN